MKIEIAIPIPDAEKEEINGELKITRTYISQNRPFKLSVDITKENLQLLLQKQLQKFITDYKNDSSSENLDRIYSTILNLKKIEKDDHITVSTAYYEDLQTITKNIKNSLEERFVSLKTIADELDYQIGSYNSDDIDKLLELVYKRKQVDDKIYTINTYLEKQPEIDSIEFNIIEPESVSEPTPEPTNETPNEPEPTTEPTTEPTSESQ